MKALAVLLVLAAVGVGAALWPRVSSHFGYATPLGLPDHFVFRGRTYLAPTGCTTAGARDRPLKQVGSIAGFLTGRKPIYRPHSLPHGLDPVYLYVRSGCLHAYDLSGGP